MYHGQHDSLRMISHSLAMTVVCATVLFILFPVGKKAFKILRSSSVSQALLHQQ
jgi:hypothetical protein